MRGDTRVVVVGAIVAAAGLAFAIAWMARQPDRTKLLNAGSPAQSGEGPDGAESLEAPSAGRTRRESADPVARSVPVGEEGGSQEPDQVQLAQLELEGLINESLDGYIYINHLLDQVQVFAELPVSPRVDLEFDDNDAVGFKIAEMPEGTRGHFIVGREGFQRNGKEIDYMEIEIQMEEGKDPVYNRDSYRSGPRLRMLLDYDSEGVPNALAVVLQRDVDLRASRKHGIDGFVGTYTTTASYRANLLAAGYVDESGSPRDSCFSGTSGLVNGRFTKLDSFPGVSPLVGDTAIDEERVKRLLVALMRSRSAVQDSISEPTR